MGAQHRSAPGARHGPTEPWESWPVRGQLACGIAGFVVFTATYRALGARRRDYEPRRDAVSTLGEGPGGWIQNVNFAVWGACTATYAAGLRAVLDQRTVAGRWVPRTLGLAGGGLAVLAASGAPSRNRAVHLAGTTLSFTAWSSAALLLVPHHAGHPRWRGWASASVVGAPVVWALGAAHGLTVGRTPSGLYERLAISAMGLWGAVFAARLLLGTPAPIDPSLPVTRTRPGARSGCGGRAWP